MLNTVNPTLLSAGAAAVAIIGAIAGIVAKPLADLIFRGFWEKRAFRGELVDLGRHFSANVKVIDAILSSNSIGNYRLSRVHIERFSVLRESIFLTSESFKHLPSTWMSNIYQFRLFIRNIDLDIIEAVRLCDADLNEDLMLMLKKMQSRFTIAEKRAEHLLTQPSVPFGTNQEISLLWFRGKSADN